MEQSGGARRRTRLFKNGQTQRAVGKGGALALTTGLVARQRSRHPSTHPKHTHTHAHKHIHSDTYALVRTSTFTETHAHTFVFQPLLGISRSSRLLLCHTLRGPYLNLDSQKVFDSFTYTFKRHPCLACFCFPSIWGHQC